MLIHSSRARLRLVRCCFSEPCSLPDPACRCLVSYPPLLARRPCVRLPTASDRHGDGRDARQSAARLQGPLTRLAPAPQKLAPMGRLLIEFSSLMTLERVQRENPNVTDGGRYTPPDCRAKQKVAIIIPFRHRDNHLKYWLHYLHPILRRQKIDYGIYIINQLGEDTFNRAKLLNIGYTEALKDAEYDCFIFSDVDLIPMDDRNLYHCYDQPRHFAIAMDKFGFRLPYAGYFGGVSGLSRKQFLKINGFPNEYPNEYWGSLTHPKTPHLQQVICDCWLPAGKRQSQGCDNAVRRRAKIKATPPPPLPLLHAR
ncbi:hypothetical protein AAFF_G00305120 [Aldrovandia affinis]|uniref:Beta-1,4-galactosyltransferase n=1 Tax=Aldrovandia affinis TaxID=143900 RepID=A0AAD7SR81_9TELE|nr:hypothetical protein AAFF_G00305120 [Aldrovandia affinis]